MIIRCWGSRGSIPVSGPEYVRYGGDTTCVEVRSSDGQVLVVDAGSGIRRLGHRLQAEGCKELSILFTHAHWDHLLGFPFFAPIYDEGTRLRMYGYPFAQTTVKSIVSRTMGPPYFPVRYESICSQISSQEIYEDVFQVGTLTVSSILLNHPNLGMGYKFEEGGRSFVFLTDNELDFPDHGGRGFSDYAEFCAGADLLIHDAEYDPADYATKRGWGHSLYTDALRLAQTAGVRSFGLFHHNQDRNDEGVDRMVEECRQRVAQAGQPMEIFGASTGWEREIV